MPLDLGDVFVLRFKDLRLDRVHSKCLVHCKVVGNWQPAATKQFLYSTLVEDDNEDKLRLVVVLKGKGAQAAVAAGRRNGGDIIDMKSEPEDKKEGSSAGGASEEVGPDFAKKSLISLEQMQRTYPPGARITLREPWFKILADGNHGLRVDSIDLIEGIYLESLIKEEGLGTKGEVANRVDQLQELGAKCVQSLDYDKALELYQLALQFPSEKKHLFYSNRSLCFLKKKQYFVAAAEAEKAVRLKPDFLKGYCRGAEAFTKGGKFARALEVLLSIPRDKIPEAEIRAAPESVRSLLYQLLKEAAVLPTAPAAILRVLIESDAQLQYLSEKFFFEACDHCVKCFLLTAFQSAQRKNLEMPDEELDDVLDEIGGEGGILANANSTAAEDLKDDLEKRKMVKERIQQMARDGEKELLRLVPKLVEMLETYREGYVGCGAADVVKKFEKMIADVREIGENGRQMRETRENGEEVEIVGGNAVTDTKVDAVQDEKSSFAELPSAGA
eukprot:g15762.t1